MAKKLLRQVSRGTVYILIIFLLFYGNLVLAQDLLNQLKKDYNKTREASIERFQLTGKYAQALFFNNQQDKAIALIEENVALASKLSDGKYTAYLYTVLAMNNRILDNATTSIDNITKAKLYAKKTKEIEIKGYVKYGEGWLAARNNKEAEAVRSFLQALQYFDSSPPSPTLELRKASVYKELTSIYANWNEYESQEKYGNLSLKIAEKQKDPNAIFEAYMSMGYMHEQQFTANPHVQRYRDLAEKYYLQAIAVYNKNKHSFAITSNLSFVANNLANLYLRFYPEEYRESVQFYALLAQSKGLETGQHNHVASAYGIHAELAIQEQNYEKAKANLLASLAEINKEPVPDQHILLSIYENLSNVSECEGNNHEALRYYKLYLKTFEAIYNKEKLGLSKRLEAQYEKEKQMQQLQNLQLESEKKEQQLQLMRALGIQQRQELENLKLREENNLKRLELSQMEAEKQGQVLRLSKLESETRAGEALNYRKELSYRENINRFFTILIGTTFLLLLLLFYAYRQRTKHMRQREQLHGLALEKERQRSNIATLTAMLDGQEQERGRLARDLHDGLGGLLSGTKLHLSHIREKSDDFSKQQLSRSIEQLDIAVGELRRVAHNLMPDLLQNYGLEETLTDYASRMSNDSTEINVQFLYYTYSMDKDQELITYRVIQELVNNAIKHAQPHQIIIQVVEEEFRYMVTVEDDGKGFDVNTIKNNNSAGLHNINSRVRFLNGNLHIQSSLNLGTSVEFEFPKKEKYD
ncbi:MULTISPECIES: sensor histidine kinase [Sphingobacterium]|uniref:ATP-binding protein n=1 Tax=Sphingobacterium TaxID=28453 RepID=UPI0013DCA720|nr:MULTISPECIES: sensor histidine kinase [unclassified Sphingobacterium]